MSRPLFPCRIRGSNNNNNNSNNNRSFAIQVLTPFSKVIGLLFVLPFLSSFLYHRHLVVRRNGLLLVVVKTTTTTITTTNKRSSSDEFIVSLYGRSWFSRSNKRQNTQDVVYPHIFSWTASDLRQGKGSSLLVDIYTASKILSSSSPYYSPLTIRHEGQPQQQSKEATAIDAINKWSISLGKDDSYLWCKTRRSDDANHNNDNDDDDDESFYGIYHHPTIVNHNFYNNTAATAGWGQEVMTMMMMVQDASSLFGSTRLLTSSLMIPGLPSLSRLIFSSSSPWRWPSTTTTTTNMMESRMKIPENTAADADVTSSSTTTLFRRNPNKQGASSSSSDSSSSWKQLLSRPAFILLATLQLALAWIYWERKVPVMNVAMYYPQMMTTNSESSSSSLSSSLPPVVVVPQVWRALTGSTAHFNLWHVGLNIMSFHQLSLELEGGGSSSSPTPPPPRMTTTTTSTVLSSSIVFFMTNLSFIAVISAVWMILEHGKERLLSQHQYQQQQQQQQQQVVHSPTVGYSGVLFAWSVVATTLVRGQQGYQSCPIPFLDQFCFGTNYIFGYKRFPFSWAPLIQLAVAQVLLPNVSWTGHLAGIIVGYAWTWNLLALPYWTSHVELTWPVLHLLSILWAMRRYQQQQQQQQRDASTTFVSALQPSPPWRVLLMSFFSSVSRFVQSSCMLAKMHAAVALLAVLVWGPLHALTLSTTMVVFCWYVMKRQQSHAEPIFTQHTNNNNNIMDNNTNGIFLGALVRCYMVAIVLNLVNTSMTFGLWWSIPYVWILQQSPIALFLLVPLQCTTLLLGLFHVTRTMAIIIKETNNNANDFQTGIFHHTIGISLIHPMTETRQRLHQWLQHVQSSSLSTSLPQWYCLQRLLSICLTIIDGGVTDPHDNNDMSHCFHSNAAATTPVTNMARNRNGTNSSGNSTSRGGGQGIAFFPGVGQRLGATTANRESEMV